MASDVNTAIPADNVQVSKSDLRQNFVIIKAEIEEQQRATSLARRIADGVTTV